ncbi:AI-2E family transporter [Acetobacter sp.]|jgi:predicted PurR-regulated permease PerM|uniref:AI-2E family transporter n=1 Tax=Acetobacter sp. TaxID=440 RepID=UPI0025B9B461|nr:AI-2E family transporter [Acetobacter sp.]MCH4089639.1 AI-2E family transporter [Acetobacter sp.]MCI1300619.1 AI-2E family transporter [Acetobacter sp.]MCI1317013.1 AI-2E family transporter [Acetobacter sp.]
MTEHTVHSQENIQPEPQSSGSARNTRPLLSVGAAAVILLAALWILRPFLPAVIWATTIAIALWPMVKRIQPVLRGSRALSILCAAFIALFVFVLPFSLTISTLLRHVGSLSDFAASLATLKLPSLPHWVSDLPYVGQHAVRSWDRLREQKLPELLTQAVPTPDQLFHSVVSYAGSTGLLIVHFVLTMLIMAFFLAKAEAIHSLCIKLSYGVAGSTGVSLLEQAEQTIRGVALGVTAAAIIETIIVAIGLFAAGMSWISVVISIVFVTCLLQVGASIIMIPCVVWAYFSYGLIPSLVLVPFAFLTVICDNFLQPFAIRKYVDISFWLILIGAVGGLATLGLAGLFVGPMILSVAVTMVRNWVFGVENTGQT